jgi:hypothetical protein
MYNFDVTRSNYDRLKKERSLLQRIEANRGNPCLVAGCQKDVVGVSAYCAGHSQKAREVGHPDLGEIPYPSLRNAERRIRRWMRNHWNEADQGALKRASFLLYDQTVPAVKVGSIQKNYTQKQKAEIVLAHCRDKGVAAEDLLVRWAAVELFCKDYLEERGVPTHRRMKYMVTQAGDYAAYRAELTYKGTQYLPSGDKPYEVYWRCPGTVKAIIGRKLRDLWVREIAGADWITRCLHEC